ncbi:hypothetical protein JRO89_XS06G0152800 [Xanthoceras sorbifolium]|uniref:GH16 domain-containing protein n=1 Tax=Xanthoceras sorbifolium TaxID=99658 RepID=A0ABQ8HYF4_9ROSI|nr:hypothetical protein JRO89_XS06G0152800 [Xanthoceras sorbifolium]
MASHSYNSRVISFCMLAVGSLLIVVASAGNFNREFDITWGDGRGKILNNGELLTLSLDKASGSGFQSKNQYLFGKIDMQLKLVPGNSAGTVTAYYLRSQGEAWDEIDFEFLGNLSVLGLRLSLLASFLIVISAGNFYNDVDIIWGHGKAKILDFGNLLTLNLDKESGSGKGDREQQFYLWFDPTADFHTYSIVWSPKHIVFYVDGIPIREFKNMFEIPFPNKQPMNVLATLWNADDWATQGGRVKTDWSYAPFTASFKNFNADACVWSYGKSYCNSNSPYSSYNSKMWFWEELDFGKKGQMKWGRMII